MSAESLRKQLYASFKNRAIGMLPVENKAWQIKPKIRKKKAKVQRIFADNNIGEIVIFPVLSCKPQNSNSPITAQRSACG